MNEEKLIRMDRMRFTKNKASSNLVLLAIVFNVLYFVSIYKSDVGSWYYNILIGASVLYNLIFMLAAFLSSEGVKNYKVSYCYLLIALGIGQIIRIFILPTKAHGASVIMKDVSIQVMKDPQYIRVIVYLVASAVCCLLAAVIGIQKSRSLSAYEASLEANQA